MILHSLLRLFSYAFHAVFIFVTAAVAVLSKVGAPHTVNFHLLPWEGPVPLAAAAVIGTVILLLGVRGSAQPLYQLWTLIVLILVVRYFFFTDYSYTPGTNEFTIALCIVVCAVVALIGSRIRVIRAK